MKNIFRKQNTLDKYGYCIHLATGKDLGDMCDLCYYDREEQWDYKFMDLLFKLPKGYRLVGLYMKIVSYGRRSEDG